MQAPAAEHSPRMAELDGEIRKLGHAIANGMRSGASASRLSAVGRRNGSGQVLWACFADGLDAPLFDQAITADSLLIEGKSVTVLPGAMR